MLDNEKSMTGMHPDDVRQGLLKFIDAMKKDVENGLSQQGILPGPFKLERRAAGIYESAKKLNKEDSFMAKKMLMHMLLKKMLPDTLL